MPKKTTDAIDVHVGRRVRMGRLLLDMSQMTLAEGLGISFQQVQKYEAGTNHIGASYLQKMSIILKVPVAFFFEGAPQFGEPDDPSTTVITRFLAMPDGLALAAAFAKIKNREVRRSIVQLVELMTIDQDDNRTPQRGWVRCDS
jgi:transcriptional regulator with XRE-family HTH domain